MDLHTKQILLRYDSTGDLYPVTTPPSQALVSISPALWHQRISHPGRPTFQNLALNNLLPFKDIKNSSLFI